MNDLIVQLREEEFAKKLREKIKQKLPKIVISDNAMRNILDGKSTIAVDKRQKDWICFTNYQQWEEYVMKKIFEDRNILINDPVGRFNNFKTKYTSSFVTIAVCIMNIQKGNFNLSQIDNIWGGQ